MNHRERVNTATDHGCFGCGDRNVHGLKLQFYRVEDGIQAEFTPRVEHEGYMQMTHGGIVSTVLDEAMSWAVIDSGRMAVTAKMEVQFRRPVPVGQPLQVRGRVSKDRGRAVETHGELRDANDQLLASATGIFFRVSKEQQAEWESVYYPQQDAAKPESQ